MAGALRQAAPKGRVKLDIVSPVVEAKPRVRPPVETRGQAPAAETAAPNPKLEAAIESSDTAEDSVAAVAEKKPASRTAQVLRVVTDVANAADPRPSRKIPTAEEWEPYIQRGLVYASVLYIWWLTTDDDGNELGDTSKFELDDERAGLIGTPFARMWARTPLNRRYGRDMIENMDVAVAGVAIVTYIMDTRPLWAAKRAGQQARNSDNKVIPMRSAQSKTVAAPIVSKTKAEVTEAQVWSQSANPVVNGGTQSDAVTEPTDSSPYKRPLPFAPGEQYRAD